MVVAKARKPNPGIDLKDGWMSREHSSDRDRLPEGVSKGSQLPDGSYQISATGPMYRGPGAGANGPFHHYVFEL
jgi:hypothetical protein